MMRFMGTPQLNYRALRWMSTVGIAPQWADWLLLAAVAVSVFFTMGPIVLVIANDAPWFVLLISIPAGFATWGFWHWSNHFKYRRPVNIQNHLESATPAAAIPVLPVDQPLPVLPIEAEDERPGMT